LEINVTTTKLAITFYKSRDLTMTKTFTRFSGGNEEQSIA